ncbi:Putative membrane protein [Corynebacterium diphtheriae]|uniref:Membrane protein n=1 Tax=Corynebacterium diphtheriae (strain ATCC 700971 / NCTC 13129 / Biotype gravis) TaxID=257309 RepID=Q6NIQ0_CORDI|nr:Putative membrane protein [Corynebacterium diphtheriae]
MKYRSHNIIVCSLIPPQLPLKARHIPAKIPSSPPVRIVELP